MKSQPESQTAADRWIQWLSLRIVVPGGAAASATVASCLMFAGASRYSDLIAPLVSAVFLTLTLIGFALWAACVVAAEATTRRRTLPILMLGTGLSFLAFASLALTGRQRSLTDTDRITVGPGFVRIEGATSLNLDEHLRRILDPALCLRRVELHNRGGSVEAAVASADYLMGRGVNTALATGDCASACAYMLLLFPHRYAVEGARLGFHDISGLDARHVDAERRRLQTRLLANRLPEDAVFRLFSTTRLSWQSVDTLVNQRLLTGRWKPDPADGRSCIGASGNAGGGDPDP